MNKSFPAAVLLVLCVLLQPFGAQRASAHPLGNFTVNRYARLELGAQEVRVYYVLDMAEVPTYQERLIIDRNRDGVVSDAETESYAHTKTEEIRHNLHLLLNGQETTLTAQVQRISFLEGQGGLHTLRLEASFIAPVDGAAIDAVFKDGSEPVRIGWREIVVQPMRGVTVTASSVPEKDVSDELRRYPDDLLSAPLDRREARFSFAPSSAMGSGNEPGAESARMGGPITKAQDAFASLMLTNDFSLGAILLSLLAAMILGAVHALSPGHGKTMVAAYLVSSRGTVRHALILGLTVTATHTITVYTLGLVTLVATAYLLPEQLYPWLSLISGVVVALVGGRLLWIRFRAAWPQFRYDGSHPHDHDHDHDHDLEAHHHNHSHMLGEAGSDTSTTWRTLLMLGVSGGLLPCPSALIVMLSAIALHKVVFGLALIIAFSAGLAAALSGIGFTLVLANHAITRLRQRIEPKHYVAGLVNAIPAIGALVVVAVGLALTAQSLAQL